MPKGPVKSKPPKPPKPKAAERCPTCGGAPVKGLVYCVPCGRAYVGLEPPPPKRQAASSPRRLTPDERAEIKRRVAKGEPQAQVAQAFGISHVTVYWTVHERVSRKAVSVEGGASDGG